VDIVAYVIEVHCPVVCQAGCVDESEKLKRNWRIVGWVLAGVALVIVAGPQLRDLILN